LSTSYLKFDLSEATTWSKSWITCLCHVGILSVVYECKILRYTKIILIKVEENMIKNEKNIVQLDHAKIGTPYWSNGVQKNLCIKKVTL